MILFLNYYIAMAHSHMVRNFISHIDTMKIHKSPSSAVFWYMAIFSCLPLCCYAAANTNSTDTFAISEEGRAGFNCSGYFASTHNATATEGGTDLDFAKEYNPVCKALNDERTFPETYHTSISGCIIASTSAVISTICSILLITIIRRSSIGLSTVSHRLVSAMSVADILASVAMGAATLPMPKNMVYEFESMSIGNEFTCNVQGLLVTFGTLSAFLLNGCLAFYYMLSISYKISDAKIQKVYEPIFYTLCIMLTLPIAILCWMNRWFNPSPYKPWCVPISYPWYCKPNSEGAAECSIRGIPSTYQMASSMFMKRYYYGLYLLATLLIMYCMASMIRITCQTMENSKLKLVIRNYKAQWIAEISENSHMKMMVMQAVAYTLAAFAANSVSWVSWFHLAEEDMGDNKSNLQLSTARMIFQIVHAVVRPSQGSLNFIVFLGQKAYDRRRIDNTLTWKQAMRTVLFDREEPHYVMNDLNMLQQDERRRKQIQEEKEDQREDDSEHGNEREDYSKHDNFNIDTADANATPSGPDVREVSTVTRGNGTLQPFGLVAGLFNTSSKKSRATNEYEDEIESVSYDPSSRNPDSQQQSMFESYGNNDSRLSAADIKSMTKSHQSSSNDGELLSFNSPSSGTFNDNTSKFDLSSNESCRKHYR